MGIILNGWNGDLVPKHVVKEFYQGTALVPTQHRNLVALLAFSRDLEISQISEVAICDHVQVCACTFHDSNFLLGIWLFQDQLWATDEQIQLQFFFDHYACLS